MHFGQVQTGHVASDARSDMRELRGKLGRQIGIERGREELGPVVSLLSSY